jgi:hypothetical protein
MANKDNPSVPSRDAMSPEEICRATQENQDRNRPDQQQNVQQGQKDIVNDNSDPRYSLTDKADPAKELPKREYENQTDRMDDLEDR